MKKIQILLFTILLIFTCSLPTFAQPEIKSKSAVLVDMKTGQVLYEKNGYTINNFDNMTKLLNVSTALNNGNLTQRLVVTDNTLLETTADSLAGRIGLASGDRITLKDALYAQILGNADDAARVVAGNLGNEDDKIGDTDDIKNYAAMMKSEAKVLCASGVTASNVMGLPSSDQLCSAMDLANLMIYGFKDTNFKQILTAKNYNVEISTSKTVEKTIPSSSSTSTSEKTEEKTTTTTVEKPKNTVTLESLHKMVNGTIPYNGVKGGFTVKTESNGFHSVTYGTRTVSKEEGTTQRKLVVAIMGAPNEEAMYEDIATLLDTGFKEWENFTLKAQKLDSYLPPDIEKKKIVFPENLECLLPKNMGKDDLIAKTEINENGYCNGKINFTLKDNNTIVASTYFYEDNNIKLMKPWVKTLLFIGIGLLILILCYFLFVKIIRPFLLLVQENKKRKQQQKKRAKPKKERGYKTAQKERELDKKDADYFHPTDGPQRKKRNNRQYADKRKRH